MLIQTQILLKVGQKGVVRPTLHQCQLQTLLKTRYTAAYLKGEDVLHTKSISVKSTDTEMSLLPAATALTTAKAPLRKQSQQAEDSAQCLLI